MAIVVKLGDKDGKRQWMDSEGTVYRPDTVVYKPKTDTFEVEQYGDERDFGPAAKPSNPKDAIGIGKTPLSTVPGPVLMEVGLGMAEGAIKYGRHNYRCVGVRASVYYDAAFRHLVSWYEGEDIDPDSGLSHISKCIASLVVLRDAMIQNKLNDDRPPASPKGWLQDLNKAMEQLRNKYEGTRIETPYLETTHPSGNK